MSKEKIIDKVKNLLARAEEDRGATLNERLTCAAIAQKLMIQHDISFGDVAQESCQDVDYTKKHRRPFLDLINPEDWMCALLNIVASVNNCEVYITDCASADGKQFSALSIVGKQSDIEKVSVVSRWLISEISRLSIRDGAGMSRSWHDDYKLGAVHGLKDKFIKEGVAVYAITTTSKTNENTQGSGNKHPADAEAFWAGDSAAKMIGVRTLDSGSR